MDNQERNREALIEHIAEQDRIIRRRNQQIENQAANARESQRAIDELCVRAVKAEKERDENGAMLSLARDALAGTEAQLDAYKARLKKSEKGRDVLAERVRDFADSIRREQETNDRLRAQMTRPLTPDDMKAVHRAGESLAKATGFTFTPAMIRDALVAALTEPPARPEGAEEIQSALIGATNSEGLELDALDASKDAYRALSDALASRGVRVTTPKEQS